MVAMNFICKLSGSYKAVEALMENCDPETQGYLTTGLAYRNPATYKKPMTAAELVGFIEGNRNYLYDVHLSNGAAYVSAYSGNDMF